MQLSELRKKAKRGKKPEDGPTQDAPDKPVSVVTPIPAALSPELVSPLVAAPTNAMASDDDEFLLPAVAAAVPDVVPSAPRTASLLESIAAVEASSYTAEVRTADPDAEAAHQGLFDDLTDAVTDDDLVEYISFLAAGEPYVIRISRVKEIIRPRRLAIVPRAASYVRGILSLRGEMIPVLDLRRSLGLSAERDVTPVSDSRIIVLAHNGAKMGLQVDRLEGVIRLDENLFRDPSEVQGSRDHRFLQAIGHFRGSFVIVLDVEKFFARGEK